MRKTFGMNRHQKAAHRAGEKRVGREQVEELVALSRSSDAGERLEAAELLCPCHVRRNVPAVWEALYRLLEDPDAKVRRAAWHTLEDGGRPDDPALDALIHRAAREETDPAARRTAQKLAAARRDAELTRLRMAARPEPLQRGKCDFCAATGVPVRRDLETLIPTDGLPRPALICRQCDAAV